MNTKPLILLSHAGHNPIPVVKMGFEYNQDINQQLKKATAARCSITLNSWYILKDEFHPGHFFEGQTPRLQYSEAALRKL